MQGEDSVEYFLGLTPSGIIVLRNKTTVAHYYWPRIAKVYFKGRYFMLRVCDKNVSSLHVRDNINGTVSNDEHIHSSKTLSLNLSLHEFLSSFYPVSVYIFFLEGVDKH